MAVEGKVITLTMDDAKRVAYTITTRQRECARIPFDAPNYETYRVLNDELEVLKMKIVKQMG
jgi:hypothetical protein